MSTTPDYDVWLEKVRAVAGGRIKRGIARWLHGRVGWTLESTEVTLHRMLAGTTVPRGHFTEAVNAWLAAGAPEPPAHYDGSAGGKARAQKLTPEERRSISAKGGRSPKRKKGKAKS